MQSTRLTTEMFDAIRNHLLSSLGEELPPVEVSEHELVSVIMNMQCEVISLRLPEDLSKIASANLEAALVAALNRAKGEIGRINAERLAAIIKRVST